jgi:FlaA1/EpsC-like NDP-sugar epimerase
MQRYFMTIPEAVSLVLQASIIGKGGEVLVLDMGEPVKIVTLAEELIRLHGMRPYADIDISFTGLRPGEKLFEEILTAEEGTMATRHEQIFVAKTSEKHNLDEIEHLLAELKTILPVTPIGDIDTIKNALKQFVKYYAGENKILAKQTLESHHLPEGS